MTQTTNALSDFTAWDLYDRFTIHEAAMLLTYRDPVVLGPDSTEPSYLATKAAMIRAFQDGELHGLRCVVPENPDDYDPAHDDAPVDWNRTEINRESLVAWVAGKELEPGFLASDLSKFKAHRVESSQRPLPLTCPKHLEPWIRLMLETYEAEWSEFDPADPSSPRPSNDEVEAVITRKSVNGERIAPSVAKVLARIIRHPDAPFGRRRDTDGWDE